MAARKFLENRLTVIAHSDQADILLSKPRLCSLQLDQLQLAKAPPIRRAKEQQHQPIRTLHEFKMLMCAKLIDSSQLTNSSSNLELRPACLVLSGRLRIERSPHRQQKECNYKTRLYSHL